jgi:hypothetical protein
MATRQFRWLGGTPPGVLHVRVNDVVTTYGPGDLVKEASHIAELGEQRIADFIKEGFAEAVNFVEGKLNLVKEVPGAMSPEEKAQAQKVAQDVTSGTAARQEAVKSAKRNIEAEGGKPEQGPPLTPSMAGPSRS